MAPLVSAVPRCSMPLGTTPGNIADAAGRSNAAAAPNNAETIKICVTVNTPT